MADGWVCPKCGRVYAPFVAECAICNNPSSDTVGTGSDWNSEYHFCHSTISAGACDVCGKPHYVAGYSLALLNAATGR